MTHIALPSVDQIFIMWSNDPVANLKNRDKLGYSFCHRIVLKLCTHVPTHPPTPHTTNHDPLSGSFANTMLVIPAKWALLKLTQEYGICVCTYMWWAIFSCTDYTYSTHTILIHNRYVCTLDIHTKNRLVLVVYTNKSTCMYVCMY